VYVEGRLEYDEKTGGPVIFQRRDKSAGAAFEVRATLVEFLDGKGAEGAAEGAGE